MSWQILELLTMLGIPAVPGYFSEPFWQIANVSFVGNEAPDINPMEFFGALRNAVAEAESE